LNNELVHLSPTAIRDQIFLFSPLHFLMFKGMTALFVGPGHPVH